MTDLATVLTRAGIEPNPEMDMTVSLTQAGMETAVPIALDLLLPDSDVKEFEGNDRRRMSLFLILQEEVKTGVEAALLNARLDPEGLEWNAFLTAMKAAGMK